MTNPQLPEPRFPGKLLLWLGIAVCVGGIVWLCLKA